MENFSPPASDQAADVDLDAAPTLGIGSYLAAVGGVVSGASGLAYGAQLLVFIRWIGEAGYVPYAIMLVSCGVLVSSAMALRMRPAFAFAFAGLAGVQLLLAIGWTIYVLMIPIVTGLGLFWPVACLPAAVLAPLTIPPALKAASFRKRLMEGL